MRLADLDEVHRLETRIFPTPWSIKSYQFEVEHNQASDPWLAQLVEKEAARIVGYIVPWILVDEVHIANIAVDPEFRQRGIARQLLMGALTRARKLGVVSATLEVRAGNQAAQKLYHSLAFEKAGRRKGYYKNDGEDAIIMRLDNLDDIFLQSQLEAA